MIHNSWQSGRSCCVLSGTVGLGTRRQSDCTNGMSGSYSSSYRTIKHHTYPLAGMSRVLVK
eukprot:5652865-Pleurochrysis_carterae.AAC.4